MDSPTRLWIVTEPYYPEQTSTGYFLTGIAECLAGAMDVGVICSMRVPPESSDPVARREVRRGVSIYRSGPRTGKPTALVARLFVQSWVALAIAWRALRLLRRGDHMLVVTNPPFLPFLIRLVAWVRRAEFDLLVHDVYPEVLVIAGAIKPGAVANAALDLLTRRLYRSCDRIIVLGEQMQRIVDRKLAGASVPTSVIPNWGDVETIRPKPRQEVQLLESLQLQDKFVVQYGGNIGRTHGLELLLEAAQGLQVEDPEVFFLIVGSGPHRARLEKRAADRQIDNVRFLDRQPAEKFTDSINACDLAVVMLSAGMAGASVPSRIYNLMAAGRPLLVVADAEAEPARLVSDRRLGWTVPPGDVAATTSAILEAKSSAAERAQMSRRARDTAVEHFSYAAACERYRALYAGASSADSSADSSAT